MDVDLRKPTVTDGIGVNRLLAGCPSLDRSSLYCNLLQCTHFAETSCVAEVDDSVAGFVSGYLLPDRSDTLFVWQVAITASLRRRGMAKKMLREILNRPACTEVCYLQTTVTADNRASETLFSGLAESLEGKLSKKSFFTRDEHFDCQHDTEYLLTIGPFPRAREREPDPHPYLRNQTAETGL